MNSRPARLGSTIATLVVAATMICGCGSDGSTSSSGPRGIILISLDTLRADHLGLHGYPRATSPFLDALAERAVVFENARVQVPGTLPSHMSIFTGLYPEEHDVFPPDGALSDGIRTLPEVFREHGFRTAGFTEGGYMDGGFGFSRGFDQFSDQANKLPTDAEDTFAKGVEFLQTLGRNDRFFLFLHTYSIHDPYYPPLPYTADFLDANAKARVAAASEGRFERYGFDRLREPSAAVLQDHKTLYAATVQVIEESLPERAEMPTGPNLVKCNRGQVSRPSALTIEFYRSLYDASIRYVDDLLRAFFGSLESLDILGDSIIVITSDHGEEFMEHGHFTHDQVYEGCLRVPLIVILPERADGSRVVELVQSIDLAPTLYELAGVPGPPGMSGRSLRALLDDGGFALQGQSYAKGVQYKDRSLHLIEEDQLFQVVTPPDRPPGEPRAKWFGQQGVLTAPSARFNLELRAFHQPRTVEVLVDGAVRSRHRIDTTWTKISVDLGLRGEPGTEVIFAADGCASPKDLGQSQDPRCLAFLVKEMPIRGTQLFNLTNDPAGIVNIANSHPDITQRLMAELAAIQLQAVAPSSTTDLDDETEERLRALGYIQ